MLDFFRWLLLRLHWCSSGALLLAAGSGCQRAAHFALPTASPGAPAEWLTSGQKTLATAAPSTANIADATDAESQHAVGVSEDAPLPPAQSGATGARHEAARQTASPDERLPLVPADSTVAQQVLGPPVSVRSGSLHPAPATPRDPRKNTRRRERIAFAILLGTVVALVLGFVLGPLWLKILLAVLVVSIVALAFAYVRSLKNVRYN